MIEAKKREAKTLPLDAAAVVRLILATCSTADEELIRNALGGAAVASIPEVARVFGVAETTVRNTWRRSSMPGDARRGPGRRGHFPLAEIVLWCLEREVLATNGRRQSSNGHQRSDAARDELDSIELATARAALKIKEARAAQLAGDTVSAAAVRAEWNAALSVVSAGLVAIPRRIRPMLPAALAVGIAGEVEREIRSALEQLSETSIDAIEVKQNGKPN